jgi:plasmid replication initiation protein
MADDKDTAPKKLSGVEYAQKKAQEAQERLAAAAAAAAEAEKPAAAEEEDEKPLDFFVANFVDCAVKDDQATMEAPMFSLSTKQDMTSWKWTSTDGKKTVVVDPGKTGRATIHDKDILIYCISRLVAAINEGKKPSRLVRFTAYDYLKATNRPTRGGDYDRFKEALTRLSGTRVTTNVETGKTRNAKGFGFINGWEIIEKSEKDNSMIAVEVELSLWIYRAIAAKEVLTISPQYFALRKPLERRLYEIARKHVGKQASWEIGIEALRDKCGSTEAALYNWRIKLRHVSQSDALPDYRMELNGDTVRFVPKDAPKD